MISFDPFPTLRTPRLWLRQLTMADVDVVFRIQSDPRVTRYLGRDPHSSREHSEKRVAEAIAAAGEGRAIRWGITLRQGGELAGTVGFWHWNKPHFCSEIGYELSPSHWGRGIMTEAIGAVLGYGFGPMGLHRVEANIDPDNHGSRRVLEKLGFTREALLRENWYYNGKFLHSAIYGLLAHEFERMRQRDAPA